jgi:hypothetical protein
METTFPGLPGLKAMKMTYVLKDRFRSSYKLLGAYLMPELTHLRFRESKFHTPRGIMDLILRSRESVSVDTDQTEALEFFKKECTICRWCQEDEDQFMFCVYQATGTQL